MFSPVSSRLVRPSIQSRQPNATNKHACHHPLTAVVPADRAMPHPDRATVASLPTTAHIHRATLIVTVLPSLLTTTARFCPSSVESSPRHRIRLWYRNHPNRCYCGAGARREPPLLFLHESEPFAGQSHSSKRLHGYVVVDSQPRSTARGR